MLFKVLFATIFAVSLAILGTWAQSCVPKPVESAALCFDLQVHIDESQYLIIYSSDYSLTVTLLTNHTLELKFTLDSVVVLPENTDIVVYNVTGVQLGDDVLIEWLVDEDYVDCISYYHVLRWDEDSYIADSVYIGQNGYLVEHAAYCMNYQFDITVYYNSTYGTTVQFNYTVPEKTNIPSLVQLRQSSLAINTTWSLEKYSRNRCNVTALYVNGTHFNQMYQIIDGPERFDVQVSITGLKADTMYYFNVSTENSAGISEAFKMGVQTLPLDPTVD